MPQGCLGVRSLARVDSQHLLDEVHSIIGHWLPPALVAPVGLAGLDFRHHPLLVAVEGRVARHEHPHNHTDAPEVTLVVVAIACQHIRADVSNRAAGGHHRRRRVPILSEAKVDEFQLRRSALFILALVQEILKLQIPVHDAVRVQVAHRSQHLPRHLRGVGVGVDSFLLQAVVELTALTALRRQTDIGIRLIHIVKPSDVRVIQGEVNFNLCAELRQLARRYVRLADALERVPSAVGLAAHEDDVATKALA
mmetsp:Transcript_82514/g.267292  ORF Transcript_82514/g.267292 Transcript_82514/m.267292 type:complete len:252 (+) Transcript_82514:1149-1904(+)